MYFGVEKNVILFFIFTTALLYINDLNFHTKWRSSGNIIAPKYVQTYILTEFIVRFEIVV